MREQTLKSKFETGGPSWSERARCGELKAVLSPGGSELRNRFLHAVELFGARIALALDRKVGRGTRHDPRVLLDFGCGTGRFLRFFGEKGYDVVGTEITAEMLQEARRFGLPPRSAIVLTDGVSIPLPAQSVDLIWVCGVLKYSLFPPGAVCRGGASGDVGQNQAQTDGAHTSGHFTPVYREIASEMYRVLKPTGLVVNVEMYVDAPPEVFIPEFEQVGFITKQVRILQRYGRLENLCQSRRIPLNCVVPAGQACAALRFWFDDPRRPIPGLRDYLFAWMKPRG